MVAPVDVVTEDRDLSRYPFVVAPAYQLVDHALIAKWTAYAENGGNLGLTARSGEKDRREQFPETLWVERLYSLIGAKLPIYDLLPGTIEGHVTADGVRYAWGAWGDVLEPQAGTTTLATYADQFYAGKAAAVTGKLGKGTVTYLRVDTVNGDLEMALMRKLYTSAGAATRIKFERHTELLRASDGCLLAKARTVWCPIDAVTGKLASVSADVRAAFSVAEEANRAADKRG